MRKIEIDLDVHRAIEHGRIAFGEDENAIMRRLLRIDGTPQGEAIPRGAPRHSRSSGAYSTMLGKEPIEANSLKELLRLVILKADRLRPGTIEEMAANPTARGRFIIARSAEELYPKTPHLAGLGAVLEDGWWYDTNLGRTQVEAYFKIIARLLKLATIPTINKRAEKTTMRPADMGL